MAEPVRTLPISQEGEDDEIRVPMLHRWIERPDGHHELLIRPLTPEDFLNPQPEDTMTEGEPHYNLRIQLADLLKRHFEPNAVILGDVIHQLGPGLPSPAARGTVELFRDEGGCPARPHHRDCLPEQQSHPPGG